MCGYFLLFLLMFLYENPSSSLWWGGVIVTCRRQPVLRGAGVVPRPILWSVLGPRGTIARPPRYLLPGAALSILRHERGEETEAYIFFWKQNTKIK